MDEPLIQYGIALAGVVVAVDEGKPAESSPAFAQAAGGGRRIGELLAWVADTDPALALPSVALVAVQLRRIRELISSLQGVGSGRLRELYRPALELMIAVREVQLRVGLAASCTRRELSLSRWEFATQLGIQAGRAAMLEAGRLHPDSALAAAIDATTTKGAAKYLEAVGGSASAALLMIERLRSQLERLDLSD